MVHADAPASRCVLVNQCKETVSFELVFVRAFLRSYHTFVILAMPSNEPSIRQVSGKNSTFLYMAAPRRDLALLVSTDLHATPILLVLLSKGYKSMTNALGSQEARCRR